MKSIEELVEQLEELLGELDELLSPTARITPGRFRFRAAQLLRELEHTDEAQTIAALFAYVRHHESADSEGPAARAPGPASSTRGTSS